MADVIVTSEALEDGAKEIKSIVHEFENMRELWDDGDIWGHSTVKGAMGDFVEKWWVKRAKLQEHLEDLQSKMESSAETWNDAESELEKSLESDGK